MRTTISQVGIGAVFFITPVAVAQTGPELLLRPWPKGEQVQMQGDARILDSGSSRTSENLDLAFYETSGRVRILSEHRADPRFGWNYTHIQTGGEPLLPTQLVDTSIGLGIGIAEWDGWEAGVTIGVGYAAAGAFGDDNAWYGMADVLIGRKIDETSSFGLVLDYDGNRTFKPDVPLPGFLYTKRLYPTLLVGLGFPFSSVEYKPNDQLTIRGRFYVPDTLEASVDYKLADQLGIFATYVSRREAFHWDDLPNSNDRLIYDARWAEAGVRWQPLESASLVVAAGYAFDQEFNVGWDALEPERLVKPGDEPYLRVGFEVRR